VSVSTAGSGGRCGFPPSHQQPTSLETGKIFCRADRYM
jgi:hypothetical protein